MSRELLEGNLQKLQQLLKSDEPAITESEITEMLKSATSKEEEVRLLNQLVLEKAKAYAGKETDEEEEEEEEEENAKKKKKKGGEDEGDEEGDDDMKKSYDVDPEYEEFVDGVPVLNSIFKSIEVMNKKLLKLEKSFNEEKEILKSMASVQVGTVELMKSELNGFGKTLLPLKGHTVNIPVQNLQKSTLLNRYQPNVAKEGNKLPEFMQNPAEIEKRLEKALDNNKLSMTLFTQEEAVGFSGASILSSNDAVGIINILKSYE